jgi:diguanylate cyclase (GGDEF)-like protein/PAS domain S-box-containing protein
MKILIVVDEPEIARSVQSLLLLNGLSAETARSGNDARAVLQQQRIDLILLDLNMPDIDGAAVLDDIKRLGLTTDVIVISSSAEIDKAIRLLKDGAKDYIRKPYRPEELLFSIRNVLEGQRLKQVNLGIYKKMAEPAALQRFLMHNSLDLLFMLDNAGHLIFVNNNCTRVLGYRRRELIGHHYSEIVHAGDNDRVKLFIQNSAFPRNAKSIELRLLCKHKKVHKFEVRAMQVSRKKNGDYRLGITKSLQEGFLGTYGVARDITDQKKSQELINFQSSHDLLTGLPNRNQLQLQLDSQIDRSRDRREKFALLLIDIKRFKLINDSYGQDVGDAVLRNFSEMLKRNTRENDFIARLGADEFILVLKNIDKAENTYAVAQKLLSEASIPYLHDNVEIHQSLNIGIAIYPNHGDNREELMRNVDSANRTAKQNTNSRFCLFESHLTNRNRDKIQVENLIRDAIKHDRFVIRYQPQIDLRDNKIHAVEALVRIQTADEQLILPGKFIPIAEETDLIIEIGTIVRKKVYQDLNIWLQQGIDMRVAINTSASELAEEDFTEEFFTTLCEYGIKPASIELELTEHVVVKSIKRTLANILRLTDAGIRIAMDDFGTGYSSLSYLDSLPLHALKLDKSFIQKLSGHTDNNSIIQAAINVAKGLKIDFIAEGVETREHHEYLHSQGHCIAQGFYYSYPLSAQALIRFIECRGAQ